MAKKIIKKRIKPVSKRLTAKKIKPIRKIAPKRKLAVKKVVKKTVAKPVIPKKTLAGVVTHFYDHISVAVIEVMNEIKQGDKLEFVGHEHQFEQKVTSMQVDHQKVAVAKKKQVIGMKVLQPVREKYLVYRK
ncbi:MAG: U32 family peptidase C-terminal domain-containing protein [Candidatus Woesearchaeota archaeon]